ncbi:MULTISPECIES: hypothetical protein [Psychrilyobacter]|uniref:hypothetical protein n=1 Tax=Psychrilyobacter TaxID=623282 RepID=UPI0013145EEB|nr:MULTISPECIES: hypothetical protein [Psychrilyobacter]NDI77458.1 hypothetical protein [Psychrilyobacter piezotolerans]
MKLLEIKSLVYSKGLTMGELYNLLGVSKQSFYRKIRKNDQDFLTLLKNKLK